MYIIIYVLTHPFGIRHWTARTFFDKNTSLWGSYVCESKKSKFFFSGDTAYCDVFKLIGDKFGPFDLSAIAIGAYKPRYAMRQVHCSPEEAIDIALDLKSKSSVGIHWGTFPMASEHIIEPALELARSRQQLNLSIDKFFTTLPGVTQVLNDIPVYDFATMNPDLFAHYMKQYNSQLSVVGESI